MFFDELMPAVERSQLAAWDPIRMPESADVREYANRPIALSAGDSDEFGLHARSNRD